MRQSGAIYAGLTDAPVAMRSGGEVKIMQGRITKKHFFMIWKEFGLKKAVKILLASDATALSILMDA